MLKVFHIPRFRSVRVLWLMEELGEPYEVERIAYPIDEAFKARTGLEFIPAIDDGGIVMGESIAILQYLTGRRIQRSLAMGLTVGPTPDPAAYAEHLQFLHLGEASLMTPLGILLRTHRLAPEAERSNFTAQDCERRFRIGVATVERRLEDGRPHVTGEGFTIADISIGYALDFARSRGFGALIPPLATAYLERLVARPAYERAAAHNN